MSFIGFGEALVIRNKCRKVVPFKTLYTLTGGTEYLSELKVENSFTGSNTYAIVLNSSFIDLGNALLFGSNESFNLTMIIFEDDDGNLLLLNNTTGNYKKCQYASEDLNILILSENSASASSASIKASFKKKCKSPEEFKKLLTEKPNLKKKYLQLKAKLVK
jgi:hypothetical protein